MKDIPLVHRFNPLELKALPGRSADRAGPELKSAILPIR